MRPCAPSSHPAPHLDLTVERPRCPYCHDAIEADDAKQPCLACMAWHHAACAAEHPRCAACEAPLSDAAPPRRRRRRESKARAPRRRTRLAEALRPTVAQLAARRLAIVCCALGALGLGAWNHLRHAAAWTGPGVQRKGFLDAHPLLALGWLGGVFAVLLWVTRERAQSSAARRHTSAASVRRGILGFGVGALIGWIGITRLLWLVTLRQVREDPRFGALLHHPATVALYAVVALLVGAAAAKAVARE
ncbi:MAG: hypothetical protein R3F62_10970 [Planctomycetota bacterium]